ncbi:FecR family protein [Novosphingobium sp. BL-52-GroH]|uniref:FecR family protein n=1 Tax=Novosphingobium sp. BL-52-GroH TaxID=3349877 RepID=UPI003850A4AA
MSSETTATPATLPDGVNARDERAAHWAQRADSQTLTAEEEAELEAWTSADPRNAGAFARAMASNAYLDRAVALGVHRGISEAENPAEEEPVISIAPAEKRGISRRLWLGGAAGAIAASLLAAVGWDRLIGTETIVADKGNVRRAALRDGSAVTLNTGTEVAVDMKPLERRVSLLAGEANFDVASDPARPFIVDAGAVRIRVVGTSFVVHLSDLGEVSVTVREGRVEVHHGRTAALVLSAGDRVLVPSQGAVAIEKLSAGEVDRLGLWQRGEMDLTGLTLADAARQYARYSDRQIVIADPDVARLKIAGVFSTSDPAGFAQAAGLAHDLRVRTSDDTITLSRK